MSQSKRPRSCFGPVTADLSDADQEMLQEKNLSPYTTSSELENQRRVAPNTEKCMPWRATDLGHVILDPNHIFLVVTLDVLNSQIPLRIASPSSLYDVPI